MKRNFLNRMNKKIDEKNYENDKEKRFNKYFENEAKVDEMKLKVYEAFEEGMINAEDKYMMLEFLNPENFGEEETVQESFLDFMNRE